MNLNRTPVVNCCLQRSLECMESMKYTSLLVLIFTLNIAVSIGYSGILYIVVGKNTC